MRISVKMYSLEANSLKKTSLTKKNFVKLTVIQNVRKSYRDSK